MSTSAFSRRQLLALTTGGLAALALPSSVLAAPSASADQRYAVFVSNAKNGNLTSYLLDERTERLHLRGTMDAHAGTAPSAYWQKTHTFYVANTNDKTISVYDFDPSTGTLTPRNTCHVDAGLVYISIDPSGKYLVGASYAEAKVVLFNLAELSQVPKATPVASVGDIPHAHSAIFSHDGRFVYVASLLTHRLLGFRISAQGQLVKIADEFISPAFGTRHQYLSQDGTRLYADSEMTGQVAEFKRNTEDGTLSLIRVSKRPAILNELRDGIPDAVDSPEGTAGRRWTAQFHASPDERFFFLSDRTTNTLFTLNSDLDYVSAVATEPQPRGFNISPDGRFIVASGEMSTHVSLYRVNQRTGHLTRIQRVPGVSGDPNWVEIVPMGK